MVGTSQKPRNKPSENKTRPSISLSLSLQLTYVQDWTQSATKFTKLTIFRDGFAMALRKLQNLQNFIICTFFSQVKVMGKTQFGFQVQFGREDIDLSYIEQLGEYSQTR